MSNKRIIEFFHNIGVGDNWRSQNKSVPSLILSSTIDVRRAFLRGYFEADGCVLKSGNIAISTVSRDLAQTVLLLLLSVGISGTLRTASINQARDGGYKIWLDLDMSVRFQKEIGFMSNRKKTLSRERCFYGTRKRNRMPKVVSYVRDVRRTGSQEDTMDVVGTRRGHFIANGIYVHNCDVMYGQFQTDDMAEDGVMGYRPMKLREGKGDEFYTKWDFDDMDFKQDATSSDVDKKYSDDYDGIPGATVDGESGWGQDGGEDDLF
jgi:hypothetical protein